MEKITQRKKVLYFAAIAITAIMGLFVASNGVAYALTGETWVESANSYANNESAEMDAAASDDGQSAESVLDNTAALLDDQDLDGANIAAPQEVMDADDSDQVLDNASITVPGEVMDAGDSMNIMMAE